MIQIYRGPQKRVLHQLFEQKKKLKHAIWFYDPKWFHYSWQGILTLINHVKTYLGQRIVDDVISHHKAVVSFALPELIDDLNSQELIKRRLLF